MKRSTKAAVAVVGLSLTATGVGLAGNAAASGPLESRGPIDDLAVEQHRGAGLG